MLSTSNPPSRARFVVRDRNAFFSGGGVSSCWLTARGFAALATSNSSGWSKGGLRQRQRQPEVSLLSVRDSRSPETTYL